MIDYVPGSSLNADVILVRTEDPDMYSTWKVTPMLGWEGNLNGEVKQFTVSGSHTSLLRQPIVTDVASGINKLLAT